MHWHFEWIMTLIDRIVDIFVLTLKRSNHLILTSDIPLSILIVLRPSQMMRPHHVVLEATGWSDVKAMLAVLVDGGTEHLPLAVLVVGHHHILGRGHVSVLMVTLMWCGTASHHSLDVIALSIARVHVLLVERRDGVAWVLLHLPSSAHVVSTVVTAHLMIAGVLRHETSDGSAHVGSRIVGSTGLAGLGKWRGLQFLLRAALVLQVLELTHTELVSGHTHVKVVTADGLLLGAHGALSTIHLRLMGWRPIFAHITITDFAEFSDILVRHLRHEVFLAMGTAICGRWMEIIGILAVLLVFKI